MPRSPIIPSARRGWKWRRAVLRALSFNNLALLGLTLSTLWLLHQIHRSRLGVGGGSKSAAGLATHAAGPGERLNTDQLGNYEDEEFGEDGEEEEEEECEGQDCSRRTQPTPGGGVGSKKDVRRWKQQARREEAAERKRRQASIPLPGVEGLPVRASDGRKPLPVSELFVHQGNYEKYMEQFDQFHQSFKNTQSFPSADMAVLNRYNFSTCAVVGSGGSLLNSSFGRAIDSHETVMRINQAPTNNKYHRHVGSKTTFRLINTRWANKYGDTSFLEEGLLSSALEEDVTLVVTRAKPRAYDNMAKYYKQARSDVRMLYLNSRVVSSARRALVGYRVRLDEVGRGPYFGGSTPSSGYLALYLMLQLCKSTTAYGFGLDDEGGNSQEYHYFHLFTDGERKNSMNPTHSFDTERELMRGLATSGMLRVCGYLPHNRNHNKKCGLIEHHRPSRIPASVGFSEFDAAPLLVKKPKYSKERTQRTNNILDALNSTREDI